MELAEADSSETVPAMTSIDGRPPDSSEASPLAPDFDQFYAAAFPSILGRVFLVVGNKHLAEDLAQDAMVEMLQQWDNRRTLPIAANTAWAIGIAVNLTRRHQRRLVTGARAVARWAAGAQSSAAFFETDVLARDEVYRRIAKLSKKQRAVAVLWAFAGMTAEEIARTLDISSSTVRTHLQRIRRHLVEDMRLERPIGHDRQPNRMGERSDEQPIRR
jgi:RNA polymerase sigma factor (sigma-70 family)